MLQKLVPLALPYMYPLPHVQWTNRNCGDSVMTAYSTTDAPTLVIGLILTGRSRSCCRWEDARVDALEST